ncbi:MAG TPA: glycoside hydrolase family 3 C-terminal domain-containing protein [Luteitalea sp.]|nr:glycoside hydrolase family 3 C-terminal domain-containing protein [Luteitalea sp.]
MFPSRLRLLTVLATACAAATLTLQAQAPAQQRPWLDADRPVAQRVEALVRAMTLEEKVSQMVDQAPAIDRLGVPAYGWWNEALHGVARAGVATVFPQAIALAATFDEPLMERVATAISDEARAKHHEFVRQGQRGRYQGLTFFSPNINIFRDPRWGRGHETYGEDPVLTGRMAVAFIHGMQGNDPTYLKTITTAKHYAVHSGPEAVRHTFDAKVSPRDLSETYLPHFERAVRDGGVMSVMTAYNAVDGVPVSGNKPLLDDLLRTRWGLKGYVVTDCGAINDMWRRHKYSADAAVASAQAVQAGTDLECGNDFKRLTTAVERGLLPESDIDRAVTRLFTARMRLGMFDPAERVAYARIPYDVNDSAAHRTLNREVARKSLVLLENHGILPLAPTVKRISVIGPTADDLDALIGNYNGTPSAPITIVEGLRRAAASRNVAVTTARGSDITRGTPEAKTEAVRVARDSDAVVLVLGLTARQEGEEGEDKSNPGGDRRTIELPAPQMELFDAVAATGTPVVVVLTGGSAQAIPTIKARAKAILMAWYPGGEGGGAVADVLFGDADPGGRLPLTFYASTRDLPPFSDYSMRERTYRYFSGTPLWSFGHGRSYTTFRYADLRVDGAASAGTSPVVSLTITNTGTRSGDEVVMAYVTHDGAGEQAPLKALAAFRRVTLDAGASARVTLPLDAEPLTIVDADGTRHPTTGRITVMVGTLKTSLPSR